MVCWWPWLLHVVGVMVMLVTREIHGGIMDNQETQGVALWVSEEQVKSMNGIPMDLYVILDGHVLPYILEPSFEKYLPTIPPEVAHINFTWKAGRQKIHYNFQQLHSLNQTLLDHPSVSIATRGRVPKRPTDFTVFLSCSGDIAGVAVFGVDLLLSNHRGRALPGMPLLLRINKRCHLAGACLEGCMNGGLCKNSVCACATGYYGPRCQFSLCDNHLCANVRMRTLCSSKRCNLGLSARGGDKRKHFRCPTRHALCRRGNRKKKEINR